MPYPIAINLDTTGLTLTAQLVSGGAVAQSVALAASATIPGHYFANGTGAANGKYGVRIIDVGGTLHGTGEIEIVGDAEASGSGGGGGTIGSGADAVTITWTNSTTGFPVADADVWITSDATGADVVAGTLQTNSQGKVLFLLDAGITYFLWMQKNNVNPIVARSFVAEADV